MFVAFGLLYWFVPYRHLESTMAIAFVLVGIVAAVLVARGARRLGPVVRTAAGAAAAAAVLRVVVDVARDPTSHNLWPLELAYVAIGSAFAGLVGGAIGVLVRRLLGWEQPAG
jgi:hypothetical protein